MIVMHTGLRLGARCTRAVAPSSRGMAFVVVGDNSAFTKLESAADRKKVFYFTATWCPPCRMIGPIFEKMATEHPDIDFCKVDVDDVPEVTGPSLVDGLRQSCARRDRDWRLMLFDIEREVDDW